MGNHAQVALTYGGKYHLVEDSIGGEMLHLDPVMMEDRPHEAAWGRTKAMAMKLDKTDDVTLWQIWHLVSYWRRDPLRPSQGSDGAEVPLAHQIAQPVLRHDQRAPLVGGYQHHQHDGVDWLDDGTVGEKFLTLSLSFFLSLSRLFPLSCAGRQKKKARR